MEVTSKMHTPSMSNNIAKRYDLVNRLLSLGFDRRWRRKLVSMLPNHGGLAVLDVATGTGDQLIDLVNDRRVSSVVGLDPSVGMIRIAQEKVERGQFRKSIEFETARAEEMPFLDGQFDVATMSFGIRNVPDVDATLREIYRVMKPAGQLLILEFSIPKNRLFRFIHLLFLRYVVPLVGGSITGSKEAYQYLDKSIEAFPYGTEFCTMMKRAGFLTATYHPLSLGIVTIYTATR